MTIPVTFDIRDWYWQVGDDESRYWSSASGSYVDALPENAGITRIANEQELTDVLARRGLLGPVVADPLEQKATKRQINAALIVSGVSATPDAWMTELLGAIVDPTARALAINDWANAPYYERTAALFNDEDLIAAAGLTSEQVDGLWALAVTLPA